MNKLLNHDYDRERCEENQNHYPQVAPLRLNANRSNRYRD